MGLSASQAKLLSITSRISSNELRAQDITRAKMRLSDETDSVHKQYTAALDNKQLTYRKYDMDGNQTCSVLTGHELTSFAPLKNQYGLVNSSGKILVSEKDAANYNASNNLDEFLLKYGIQNVNTEEEAAEEKTELETSSPQYSNNEEAQWYINLWYRMNGESDTKTGANEQSWEVLGDGPMNSDKWLKNALEQGTVTLERVDFEEQTDAGSSLKHARWTSIIYSSATEIGEETNDEKIAKAEAEFEEKTKVIEAKDKQYDNVLKLLDTEHTALQQEYDSVKGVISKNIDRTLRIYSA